MDFGLSDEQRHFQESVRRFARERLAPRYAADDRRGEIDPRTRAEMAELGLMGIAIPEAYGGQGASAVTTGIAAEELSAGDFNAAYLLLIPMLAAEVIVAAGSDAQREALLPPIADGSILPCFCLTEPEHGSDAARLSMRAQRGDGDGWWLSGEKTSISLGASAEAAVVFARTSDDGARGISAFYVQLDERHVQRSPFADLGSRAIGRAALHFDGLPVGADALLGAPGEGFVRCMQGFEFSRAVIGLMCIGCAQAALDEAIAYARDREAFGRPIGANQGVAFPLAEAATLLRGARWVCYEALWRRDSGLPHRTEASMAKWWAPKVAVEAAHQALLTLGHSGYSEELPAGQRVRDLIGLEIGDGTAQIAKLVLARELLGRAYAP
ncbi:MAG TPA: acyl-CoA dehydrogenase family protein [Solirubrobacteraceae bacterium]|nr:acyl-CoA dehydrogenase family protein [Solirubrobacteraceae bacterium]